MYIAANTDTYCVVGNPVKHSLSPPLHTYMFEFYGVNAIYVAFEVEDIVNAILGMKSLGIKGANITIPFKEHVAKLVDELDEDAEFLGSVNTVKNDNGKLIGYNTDFLGFMYMFDEYAKFCSDDDVIVVLGAGGVAVSVVYALYKLGIKKVLVLNRNTSRAEKLAEKFDDKLEITVGSLNDKNIISDANVIINCTPVGLNGEDVPIDLSWVNEPLIADVIYYDTPLVKSARDIGLTSINGLDMFIAQANYSFKIWTGMEFDMDMGKKLIEDLLE